MRSHRIPSRTSFVGLACLAVALGGGAAVAQSSPPATPGPTATAFPRDAIVLQGTISGTNSGMWSKILAPTTRRT